MDLRKCLLRQPKRRIKRRPVFFRIGRISMPVGDDQSPRPLTAEGEAAGAGLAALALLSRLLGLLVETRKVSAGELREAVDDALLSLEQGQGDSPAPQATACARQCLESVLAMLDSAASGRLKRSRSRTHKGQIATKIDHRRPSW